MTLGKHLLLVDDEPANLLLLEACLLPLGHGIRKVSDGRAAVAAFNESPPDLILLDLVMPGFDGLDVLAHVRAHGDRGDTPVILLTAHSEREHRLRGIEAGADDFLEKPIDISMLRARVRTLLKLKEFRDQLRGSRDELVLRNEALERAQRDQRELTEFIIHDLRGPLTAVVANAQWVYDRLGAAPAQVRGAMDDVLSGANRLRTMIGDLVAVSRFEHGTFPIQLSPTPVAALLNTAVSEFRRLAEQKKIALTGPSDFGGVIPADAALIQRVFENILDNSLRHTPPLGRVSVVVRDLGDLEIAVANSGPPVPVGDRQRIFEKFVRSDDGARMGHVGLGLYFCKRAVEAHGGQIDVIETPEFPTCFRIRLPAA